jgi:hypothetical protein
VRLEAQCVKLHTSSHRATTLRKFEDAMASALRSTKDAKALKVKAS